MTTATLSIRKAGDTEWRVAGLVDEVKFAPAEVYTAPIVTTYDACWNVIPSDMAALQRMLNYPNPFLSQPTQPTIRQVIIAKAVQQWQLPDDDLFEGWLSWWDPDQSLHLVPYCDYHGRRQLIIRWYRYPYWETFTEAAHRITTAERARWLSNSIPQRNHYRAYLRSKGPLTLAEVRALKGPLQQRNPNTGTAFRKRGRN